MFQRFSIFFVLVLLCNCSSPPIKKQHVVLSKDYKNYITLKEEPHRKTIPQKIKEVFKKPETQVLDPAPKLSLSEQSKGHKKINTPSRRIRQTNTNDVLSVEGQLMPMKPRVERPLPEPKSNVIVYFIWIQAIIIAVLCTYMYFKLRSPKVSKLKPERKLNL